MTRATRTIWLGILLCTAAIAASTELRAESTAGAVEVQLGPDLYKVPAGYFVSRMAPKHPLQEASFNMVALLPSLDPRTPANIQKFVWTDAKGQVFGGFDDILRASITYDPKAKWRDTKGVIAEAIHSIGLTADQYVDAGDGVRLYSNPGKSVREYYVAAPKSGSPRFWSCDTAGFAPRLNCQIVEEWSNTVRANVNFDKRYVNQTIAIDKRLRALVESFKIKAPVPH